MITYQKVYTDHVHSSTLMSQFTQLWKNHLMCDAELIIGNTIIKAHRLVLVASCAVLHSNDSGSPGSLLEVTLPGDIPSNSVYTFLEFLYQGHMILSEENVEYIEKIARLLNVEDVLNCCRDFIKTVQFESRGQNKEKFSFHDLAEVNHVRSTNFIKSVTEQDSVSSRKDNKHDFQNSSNIMSSSSMHHVNNMNQTKTSAVSFSQSPVVVQRERIQLGDHQHQIDSRSTKHSIEQSQKRDVGSSHSVIDLSEESFGSLHPALSVSSHMSTSPHRRNSDQPRSYSHEHTSLQLSSRRRHSDQSRPNSMETSSSPMISPKSHDNYSRSMSDENLNPNNMCNPGFSSYASQYGFAMPVIPSGLWTEKAILQHYTSHQNPRSSSSNSISSSGSKASISQQGTRPNDLSDLPICIEQEDSEDSRMVLDVSEIDLSMIKTENIEEPLDLHVEGVIQDDELLKSAKMSVSQSLTANSQPVHQKPVPNQPEPYPVSSVYSSTYQPNLNNDTSKHWSAQLQSAMIKKKPGSMSTNVRKIIQDLNLNRRALASPAALSSLAVGNHKPIRMPGKNNYKVCSLCYRNKIRTKSGYYVYSYYKCSVCDVPLCIGRRKCFLEYHREAEEKARN